MVMGNVCPASHGRVETHSTNTVRNTHTGGGGDGGAGGMGGWLCKAPSDDSG